MEEVMIRRTLGETIWLRNFPLLCILYRSFCNWKIVKINLFL